MTMTVRGEASSNSSNSSSDNSLPIQEDTDDRDPRLRPWYVRAATRRRDAVVIIHYSSHHVDSRTSTGKVVNLLRAVLGMFDVDDMVQVVVDGYTPGCLPTDKLVPKTADNFAHVERFVNETMDGGNSADTNTLRSSFNKAWKLLEDSRAAGVSTNCSRQIFLITDAIVSQAVAAQAVERFAELEAKFPVQTFTISLEANCGFCADLTCKGQGLNVYADGPMQTVETYTTLFGPFVQVMSQTLSGSTLVPTDTVSVTPPIRDPRTGDLVISMSKAVFYKSRSNTMLEGVVSIDVSLSAVWQSLRLLAKRPGTYTAIMYRTQSTGTLLEHPMSQV